MVLDPQGEHLVCAHPASAIANGAPVLVPPQQRYDHAEAMPVTVQRLLQSLLTYRLRSEALSYLGYGFGNQHYGHDNQKRHSKYVHWFAHVVPNNQRLRQFHRLLRDTSEFSSVQWLRIDEFLSIYEGGTVSDEKLRLVMQALWVLTRDERLQESAAARVSGRYLAPELLPTAVA